MADRERAWEVPTASAVVRTVEDRRGLAVVLVVLVVQVVPAPVPAVPAVARETVRGVTGTNSERGHPGS